LPRLFPPPEFVDQLLLPPGLHLLLLLLPLKAPVIGLLPHLLLPHLVLLPLLLRGLLRLSAERSVVPSRHQTTDR